MPIALLHKRQAGKSQSVLIPKVPVSQAKPFGSCCSRMSTGKIHTAHRREEFDCRCKGFVLRMSFMALSLLGSTRGLPTPNHSERRPADAEDGGMA